jgi:myo-inositol catabolism protein IolC
MDPGYTLPLYLLPFDHRHSYVAEMFHFHGHLRTDQRRAVIESKQVIYDGFRLALDGELTVASAGLLVDEEFGASILRDASRAGYVTVLATERSGSAEFEFEYGSAFAAHIDAFQPSFAKALVRYNPEGDTALNVRQAARLRQLSTYCRRVGQRFMVELLVPATEAQRARAGADQCSYDQDMRPALMLRAIRAMQDAGVEPDIWKIEGLDRREDCERVVNAARRDGRGKVGCIVLGRHAADEQVVRWLATAGSVPGFIGFAVGRTTFWDAVADYVEKRTTRRQAASRIAHRYREWASIFERSHRSRRGAA